MNNPRVERKKFACQCIAGQGRTADVFMVQVRNVCRALAAEHLEPAEVTIRANNVTANLMCVELVGNN